MKERITKKELLELIDRINDRLDTNIFELGIIRPTRSKEITSCGFRLQTTRGQNVSPVLSMNNVEQYIRAFIKGIDAASISISGGFES
jgi:hypothetical protein